MFSFCHLYPRRIKRWKHNWIDLNFSPSTHGIPNSCCKLNDFMNFSQRSHLSLYSNVQRGCGEFNSPFKFRHYAKDIFLDDPSWDIPNDTTTNDSQETEDNIFIEEAELQSYMENFVKVHRDTPLQVKQRKFNDKRRNSLLTKIYNLESIGSKSEKIYKWLAECIRLSRENREYSQGILYADRIIERFIKEYGESSIQVGNARMEKAKLLAITQDWSGCLSEISQVLQCHGAVQITNFITIDRLTSIYLAEYISRQMPSSFRIPWAPTFTWRQNESNTSNEIYFQPEDGIQYLPPLDQWCNILLDHLKFTVKEIGFQQYKPHILRNVAWMISRQTSDFSLKSEKVFEQLEPTAYIDIINRKEYLSEKVIKDIQVAIKHFKSVSQYYQKKNGSASLLGDIEYDIALANYRISQRDEAIKACQKAISFYNKTSSASLDIARCCHLLALCLKSVDKSQAITILSSALDIMENIEATYNIEYLQFVYSYLWLSDNRTSKQRERLKTCMKLLSDIQNCDILDYFLRLPIAVTEWNDIGADKKLMQERLKEMETIFESKDQIV